MSGLVGYLNNPVRIVTGADAPNAKEWIFDNTGNIKLPQGGNVLDYNGNVIIAGGIGGNLVFEDDTVQNSVQGNSIILQTTAIDSTTTSWEFNPNGTLSFNGSVLQNNSLTRSILSEITTASPTVVWSSSSTIISSVKLILQLEQEQVGDPTGFHTHSCEAIISARGTTQTDIPTMSVYGVNYTYTGSLVTFTVQRNISTGIIEVVATLTDTTNPAYLSIHSIEQTTRGLFIL